MTTTDTHRELLAAVQARRDEPEPEAHSMAALLLECPWCKRHHDCRDGSYTPDIANARCASFVLVATWDAQRQIRHLQELGCALETLERRIETLEAKGRGKPGRSQYFSINT